MRIRNKIIVVILLSSILPILLCGVFIYNLIVDSALESINNHLMETSKTQEAMIYLLFNRYLDNIKMISNRINFTKRIDVYNKTKNESLGLINQASLDEILRNVTIFHEISIFDLSGDVIVSTNRAKIGKNYSNEEYFIKSLNKCGYIDVFKGEDNEPDFHFSCPLSVDGRQIAILIAILDGRNIIDIANDYTGLGKTGETVVSMRDKNGNAVFIVPTRHDNKAAFKRVVSRNDTTVLITQALMKKNDIFKEYYDYRGVQVLGVTRYIDKIDWGIVIKIDKSEFLNPLIHIRNMMIIGYIILISVIIITVVFFINKITKPLSHLSEMTLQIIERGIYQKVEINTKDEIGDLSRHFNHMIDNLNDTYVRLEHNLRQQHNLAHQHEVVSAIGVKALSSNDLQSIMDESVNRIAKALDVEYCKILKLLPEGNELLLVSGVGWKEGLVGNATVSTDINSQAGYTLISREPIVVENLLSETRFNGPSLLVEHAVISGISVIIYTKEKPWGVMGAHTTKKRMFSGNDINFFQSVANVLSDVIERMYMEEQVQNNLNEKTTLLKEIHHRVKNNLQIISSLIGIAADRIKDKQIYDIFNDITNRIRAMALVHEELYMSENIALIDFREYTVNLTANLSGYYENRLNIHYSINIENIFFNIDTALPCGLILNELVSNSLKHAFTNKYEGNIVISLFKEADSFILSVKDDGIGIPADFEIKSSNSLGMVLIHTLARQLKGAIKITNDGGTEVRVVFKEKKGSLSKSPS